MSWLLTDGDQSQREETEERGERERERARGICLASTDRTDRRGVLSVLFLTAPFACPSRHVSVFGAHLSEKRSNEAKRLFSAFCNGLRDFTVFFATD